MTVQVTPLHDRVLVRRLEEKETAKGGIIIPDTAKEKPMEGIVIAAGTGKFEKGQTIPLAVKEGDRVLGRGCRQSGSLEPGTSWFFVHNKPRCPWFGIQRRECSGCPGPRRTSARKSC